MTRRIGNTRFPRCGLQAIVWVLFLVGTAGSGPAQNAAPERTFRDSKAAVEKTLKGLQSSIAGRLPLLDGFAVPADRPLDRFQRAYYQCTVV